MVKAKVLTWWDPACQDAARIVKKAGKATPQVIMKGLGVGYGRADFILTILQRMGMAKKSKGRARRNSKKK
jgi:hypothetical protein